MVPPPILLDQALAMELVGGLLAICRADGDVDHAAFEALREAAAELAPEVSVEDDRLLLDGNVTPWSLAAAANRGRPFRSAGRSEPAEIGRAFLRAALRVARADGELSETEARAILGFARQLGIPSNDFRHLEGGLDLWASRIKTGD